MAKKFRLVTRSDFDGLVCAVLLKHLDMIDDILFVHPKDMQDGKIAITDNDITTNLPYVPEYYAINKAAEFEPRLALFAGNDGLDLYRRFWQEISQVSERPRFIVTESLKFQHHALASLARTADYVLTRHDGLVQLFERI